ncbi:MAG TPA: glycosyltransferase [Rhabdochlamydiaceae bacterium]|nr:glycosyltransferase [Rhabdochlamydiaceae bacterium]
MSSIPHVVLLKSQLFRLGGAEKYAYRIAQAFRSKNCRVTILTDGPIKQPSCDPLLQIISNDKLPLMSFLRVEAYDAFCRKNLQEINGDLIFGLDRNRFQTHIRASNGVHAAYLEHRKHTDHFLKRSSYRFNPLHRTLLQIEKESFNHSDLKVLFTNSFMVRDEILKYYSTDPQKIQVLHNGVEWHEMQTDFTEWPEMKPDLSRRFQVDPETFHFVFIGHNYARKGLEKLLKGLSILKNREFHLSVIGKEKNPSRFIALAKKLNLDKHVTFFGMRSDIRSFYQLADALVIPSFYDPFANVTVEALGMGVFVVSSKTNGGHEILNSLNGSIIESLNDAESIAKALEIAMEHRKTFENSKKIRESVRYLDFSNQLELLTDISLEKNSIRC